MHVGLLAADLTHQDGWAHYGSSLIRALRRAGIDLTILTTHNSPLPDDLRDVRVERILPSVNPMARGLFVRSLALIPSVRAALRNCAVIHTFVEPFAPLAWLAAGKRPFFITMHGSYAQLQFAYPRYARRLYTAAFEHADVIAVSRYTAGVIEREMRNVHPHVIANGVDVARFDALPALAKNGHTILTVGAVKPRKGTLYLIQALDLVRETFPEVHLNIVGSLQADTTYTEVLRSEITRLGVAHHVTLTGRVSDDELRAHYARANVFAFPSVNDGWRFEGFGLAALEASAAGLPVVGSRDCGVEDAIDHGLTGFLTPQRDSSALADAIIRLLSDPGLRESMGAAGREKARVMTWERAAAQVISLYQGSMQL